jgi:methylamine dehydrogenase heavy chain
VYPDHWLMVHDVSFFHMSEGEVLVVDPLATSQATQYKGMMTASFIADFERGVRRKEHYVIETFFARGTRGGDRTDVVTIYDTANLAVQGEVVIPSKRMTGMPKPIASSLTPDERFLMVYNFTPAQSVSVVDLEKRSFVGEVPTPGCAFAVPTGQRSFFSICSNGTLRTVHLGADGAAAGTGQSDKLFDADADPVFEAAAVSNGVASFPTFQGRILPIDVNGETPLPGEAWWLTGEDERGWRPGGLRPIIADASGLGYILMHPEGAEGTHKNGGSEVWVLDLDKQKRLDRFELRSQGLALGTTGTGDGRLLAVTTAGMAVDIYRLPSGEFVHTLQVEAQTPFVTHGAN